MAVSRYTSQFRKAKKEEKPVTRKPIIREKKVEKKEEKSQIVEKLTKVQDLTKRFQEAEVSIETVDKTIGEINELIKDVIDEVGSTNPVIDTLINAASQVEAISAEMPVATEEFPSLANTLADEEIDLSAEVGESPEVGIAPEMEIEEPMIGEEMAGEEGPSDYNFGETLAIDDEEVLDIDEEKEEEKE